jgi:hypothetical protein
VNADLEDQRTAGLVGVEGRNLVAHGERGLHRVGGLEK